MSIRAKYAPSSEQDYEMTVFEHEDYRAWIKEKVRSGPKGGRGELLKIAKHVGIHTTTLSQILAGTREMPLEQAASICSYFGMRENETQYFILLVQHSRAGTVELKKIFREQIRVLKDASAELVNVIPHDKTLTEQERATFYSQWYFSGVRVLSSIDGFQTSEALADYFRLPRQLTNEIVDFLLASGLCVRAADGIRPGAKYTHLGTSSPLSARHHANWRLKAIEKYARLKSDEFVYTSPMSLSASDAAKVRELLLTLAKEVNEIRAPSPCEQAFCLNLDWLRLE